MRVPDWNSRLMAVIRDAHMRRFEFGVWDCCLFASDWYQAVTGVDHASKFRGQYESAIGALHVLRKYGGSLESFVTQVLQREPIPVAEAIRGDLVLGRIPDAADSFGGTLGGCLGPQWGGDAAFIFPREQGVWVYGSQLVTQAWRVD